MTTLKIGDPDPTASTVNCCPAQVDEGDDYYLCTRSVGHLNDHVAGDGRQVVWVWPRTRRVRVTEYGEVAMSWHYAVEVPASLREEEAHQAAIAIVQQGDVAPYDTSTGDQVNAKNAEWGTDLREPWDPPLEGE